MLILQWCNSSVWGNDNGSHNRSLRVGCTTRDLYWRPTGIQISEPPVRPYTVEDGDFYWYTRAVAWNILILVIRMMFFAMRTTADCMSEQASPQAKVHVFSSGLHRILSVTYPQVGINFCCKFAELLQHTRSFFNLKNSEIRTKDLLGSWKSYFKLW